MCEFHKSKYATNSKTEATKHNTCEYVNLKSMRRRMFRYSYKIRVSCCYLFVSSLTTLTLYSYI